MQLSNTWKATVGLMIGAILCLPAQAAAEKKIIMRYSHSSAAMVEEPHHTAALDFKKYVEEKTKGRVEVQIYPASQLGGEERAFQDVQQGILQMTVLAVNNASIFSPSLGAFDLPYIFKSVKEFDDCVDQNWDLINKRMEAESGTIAIAWHSQGFRFITNSKQPVAKLADLAPVKIRTPNNPIMIATFRAWGGEPAPMAWDETFNALQQKVVDGQENPYPVFASNKFEEVQKYITEIHYKVWIGPIVVNAAWFKKQPADVQKAILEGGRLATENNRKMIAEMETDLVKVLKDKGVEILAKPEDEPVWQEKAMGVWPQFYDKIGDISLLDTMMKSLGRTRPQ